MIDNATLDYTQVKMWLRHGDIAELAARKRISKSLAYKVLKGEVKNFDFMQACYERAIENKVKFKALNDRLKSLNS